MPRSARVSVWPSSRAVSLGYITPEQFIPLAEECGLIHEIGAVVLEDACSMLAQLPKVDIASTLPLITRLNRATGRSRLTLHRDGYLLSSVISAALQHRKCVTILMSLGG
ncbi:hypothetical protein [Agrobacterium tumefaciens]|uniref:hypothetical protein n=1 Tax=Agrobacterium tumefaciens TaxID=358 RepID=UPI002242D4C4|nr:hypothetical protein [Agrobacterium tumefaciens]